MRGAIRWVTTRINVIENVIACGFCASNPTYEPSGRRPPRSPLRYLRDPLASRIDSWLQKYRRIHPEALTQRPDLAHIQFQVAGQDFRHHALVAHLGQVGRGQTMGLHEIA